VTLLRVRFPCCHRAPFSIPRFRPRAVAGAGGPFSQELPASSRNEPLAAGRLLKRGPDSPCWGARSKGGAEANEDSCRLIGKQSRVTTGCHAVGMSADSWRTFERAFSCRRGGFRLCRAYRRHLRRPGRSCDRWFRGERARGQLSFTSEWRIFPAFPDGWRIRPGPRKEKTGPAFEFRPCEYAASPRSSTGTARLTP